MHTLRLRSRGAVMITFLLVLIALIGIVCLAIDTGRAYGIRAKLATALDLSLIHI